MQLRVLADHARLPLAEGDRSHIGGYRIVGRLGHGGMGAVFLGVGDDGDPVAVKQLHAHLAGDETFRARFRREAALAARVDGRYTASVLATGLDEPTPWIASRYVAGPPLASHLARHGPLTGDELISFAAATAQALSAIHAAGVVHRDLTSRNVLLAADGPKLVDFGIAGGEQVTTITATGQLFGTPGSVAPEVVLGQPGQAPADVFAWGALVVTAATGHGPFGTGTADQLLYRLLHEPPQIPDLPEPLGGLVRNALQAHPQQRPAATQLAAVLVGGDGSQDAVTRLVTASWQLDPDVVTVDLDPSAKPRRRWWPVMAIAAATLLGGGVAAMQAGWLDTLEPVEVSAPVEPEAPAEPAAIPEDPAPEPEPDPEPDEPVETETPPEPEEPPTLRAPDAPWAGEAVPPESPEEAEVAAWWSEWPWPGCSLYYPVGYDRAIGARALTPETYRTGNTDMQWVFDDFDNAGLYISVWGSDAQHLADDYLSDSPAVTFSDGSELYSKDDEWGMSRLLAIAGQDCFYEIIASDMVSLNWGVEGLRRVQLP